MKGMTILNAIIAVILFLSVFSGIGIFYFRLSDTYNVENTTFNFTEINRTQADIENRINIIRDKLQTSGKTPLEKVFDIGALFLFEVGGLIIDLGSVGVSLVGETTGLLETIHVPTWFTGMLISIVLVFFVFKVIGLILKKEA